MLVSQVISVLLCSKGNKDMGSTRVTQRGENSPNLHCRALQTPLLHLTVDLSAVHDDTPIVSKCSVLWDTLSEYLHVLTLTHSPCGQLSSASADSQAHVVEDPSRVLSP